MGGGYYDTGGARERAEKVYQKQTREEKFKNTGMDPSMDPKNIRLREARDSEDHPASCLCVIAFDQTGSMGEAPDYLISHELPNVMDKVIAAGLNDLQIMFMGIGDSSNHFYERGPLQVGQAESQDTKMEHWLKSIFLEGKGGGNGHESYPLVWYFCDRHVVTDAWENRGKKGLIITIGDEPCQRSLSKEELDYYIGDNPEGDVNSLELLERIKEKWDVYHIHCDGTHTYFLEQTNWKRYLGINAVRSVEPDVSDIGDIITRIILNWYEDNKD